MCSCPFDFERSSPRQEYVDDWRESAFRDTLPRMGLPCRLCSAPTHHAFDATVLNRHRVGYHKCMRCGFLQTDEPYWLDEAYADATSALDTGLVTRNVQLAEHTLPLVYSLFDRKGRFVDWAGGSGLFTRLMRDAGLDFRTYDPHAANIFARGFEASPETPNVELVTSFESFEHFARPLEEARRMLAMSRSLLFSTELMPCPCPAPDEWWYYSREHGQHIAFYETRTLQWIAAHLSVHYRRYGTLHLFTDRGIAPSTVACIWRLRRPLALLARLRMRSLTLSDHERLAHDIRHGTRRA